MASEEIMQNGFRNLCEEISQLRQAIAGYDLPSGKSLGGLMYQMYESEQERLIHWADLLEKMRLLTAHQEGAFNRICEENTRLQTVIQRLRTEREMWISLRKQGEVAEFG